MNERDLAEAIYGEITNDGPENYTNAALIIWDGYPGDSRRERMARVLAFVTAVAVDKVLTRRQHEAARTGPWQGAQEESSLLPPKRSAKLSPQQALEIRTSTARGVDLARRYDISPATVSLIRRGRVWKSLAKCTP